MRTDWRKQALCGGRAAHRHFLLRRRGIPLTFGPHLWCLDPKRSRPRKVPAKNSPWCKNYCSDPEQGRLVCKDAVAALCGGLEQRPAGPIYKDGSKDIMGMYWVREEDVACYRLYAANCIELARHIANTDRRLFLLKMAQAWIQLADYVESAGGTVTADQTLLPHPE
jgi:hypothetical protein